MSSFLQFGQLIIIKGETQDANGNEIHGFLSTPGFTENRVFFQKTPVKMIMEESVQNIDENYDQSFIRNQNDSIFQIWPKLNCDAHKELRKKKDRKIYLTKIKSIHETSLEKEERRQKEGILEDDEFLAITQPILQNIRDAKKHLNQLEDDILKLKDRVQNEVLQNQNTLQQIRGEFVQYDQEIQIMHYNSNTYLCGSQSVSEFEQSAYKFELTKNFGTGMIFKIKPKFKLRSDGEKIQFQDQILLKNFKLGCFVNFSMDQEIILDRRFLLKPLDDQQDVYPKIDFRGESLLRFESHLSHIQDTTFQILLFSNDEKQYPRDSYLKGGDLIRLQHTEKEGFLAADHAFNLDDPEVFVRVYDGKFLEEKNSIDSVWEIEIHKTNNRGNTCKLNQKIDYVNHSQTFRLRHFRTGKLLSFVESKDEDGKRQYKCILGPHFETERGKQETYTNSKLKLKQTTVSQKNEILNDDCYQIQFQHKYLNVNTHTLLQPNEEEKQIQIEKQNFDQSLEQQLKESFYTPLKDSEYHLKRLQCTLEKGYSEENSFFIKKVSDQEKKEMLHVLSAIPSLKRLAQIMKWKQKDLLTNQYLKHVMKVIESLIFFILKMDSALIDAVDADGTSIDDRVQRLCKDMKVIEVVGDILYYSFQEDMFKLNEIHQTMYLQRILQLCYRLIKHTIREYRPNEVYASQWIDLFMVHVMNTDLENDLKSEATLTELIDNNQQILQNKIKKSAILKFIYLLKDQHAKYVNILKALVNCNGQAVIINQSEISKPEHGLITKSEQNELLFKLKQTHDEVQIHVYDVWLELQDFEDRSKEDDNSRVFNYFCAIINLCADLCLDRNKIAMDTLSQLYPFSVCYEICRNNNYNIKTRHAFTRLITTLWIDRNFTKIQLPNRIRIYENLDNANFVGSENNTDEFEGLISFIKQYIQEITKIKEDKPFSYQQAFQNEQNNFTIAVLNLCKQMLQFGFYKNQDNLIELLSVLLILLNGTSDITLPEENLYINSFYKANFAGRDDRQKDQKFKLTEINKDQNLVKIGNIEVYRLRSRYNSKKNEDSLALMEAKKIILEILSIIFDMRNEQQITKYIQKFKKYSLKGDVGSSFNMLNQSPTIKAKYSQIVSEGQLEKTIIDKEQQLPLKWVKSIIRNQSNFDYELICQDSSGFNFVVILLDLLLYDDEDLVKLTFNLLNRHFSQQAQLVNCLQDIQLIEDEQMLKNYNLYKKRGQDLLEWAYDSELWYQQDDQKSIQTKNKFLAYVKQFSNVCTNQDPDKQQEITIGKFKQTMIEEPDQEIENDKLKDYKCMKQIMKNIKFF